MLQGGQVWLLHVGPQSGHFDGSLDLFDCLFHSRIRARTRIATRRNVDGDRPEIKRSVVGLVSDRFLRNVFRLRLWFDHFSTCLFDAELQLSFGLPLLSYVLFGNRDVLVRLSCLKCAQLI